jgi:Sec-independent protein secretion pathway component TatC
MLPLLALYEAGIQLARLFEPSPVLDAPHAPAS